MLVSAVLGAVSVTTAALAPAAAADGPAWATKCTTSQLTLAPFLSRDKANDGSPLSYRPLAGGSFVPVVMVHGWTGSSVHDTSMTGNFSHTMDLVTSRAGTQTSLRTLIGNIQEIPGTAVFTFDYHNWSGLWVTDSHIGQPLANALECLREQSGQKPIVVTHSMGGLATREALQLDPLLAQSISQVIDFGTPNTGSDIAAYVKSADHRVVARRDPLQSIVLAYINRISAACRDASKSMDSATCSGIHDALRAFGGPGAAGLATGSEALGKLNPWPAGLAVHALAGNTSMTARHGTFLGFRLSDIPSSAGDLIVPLGSATSQATTIDTADCKVTVNVADDAAEGLLAHLSFIAKDEWGHSLLEGTGLQCFHGNLMRIQGLAAAMTGYIADDVGSRAPKTRFVTLDPWRDGSLSAVSNTFDAGQSGNGASGSCNGSEIAVRSDGYRCYWPGIYDPCFQSPTAPGDFLCVTMDVKGQTGKKVVTRLANMAIGDPIIGARPNKGAPDQAPPVRIELSDGTACARSTGAGPEGAPGYPTWVGRTVRRAERRGVEGRWHRTVGQRHGPLRPVPLRAARSLAGGSLRGNGDLRPPADRRQDRVPLRVGDADPQHPAAGRGPRGLWNCK
ncbi:hypothetical protein GCM10027449_26620 [Sinomonas notoginsengisoli]